MKAVPIFALGFAIRIFIIALFPITWGGDTILRLFEPHDLMKGRQLPMLQALIWGTSLVSTDPQLVRCVVALIGAYTGLAFYWVAGDLFGQDYAMSGALMFITHPYILAVIGCVNRFLSRNTHVGGAVVRLSLLLHGP